MRTAATALDVFRLHGGNVEAARTLFPEVRSAWIDLSTGISPWVYPHERIEETAFTRLPDPEAIAELERAAAHSFGVADASCVIASPGSDLALRLLGPMYSGRRIGVVRPGYSGHLLAWGEMPVTAMSADDLEAAAQAHDVIVLANPNNPDGRVLPRERLLAVRSALAARTGMLIVDEAFADVLPEHSVCSSTCAGLIVFRSFGKFFGLAGLRLGFVVAAQPEQRRFRQALGDWPVCGPAVTIGTAAYRDLDWQMAQRARLRSAAERLDALLTRAGFTIAGGTTLFRLARCSDADAAFHHLVSHGILTRPFTSDPTLLRVGLPADETHWARLADALTGRRMQ
jgi:cobalamin biosynthetic protein CobC